MSRIRLYDIVSVVLIGTGCLLALAGLRYALRSSWTMMVIFGISSAIACHLSCLFAQYAIAASGRQ